MKKLLPLTFLALLLGVLSVLSACEDSKLPKPPPKVPEPKLVTSIFYAAPASLPNGSGVDIVTVQRRS
jgi:hypothetical protein